MSCEPLLSCFCTSDYFTRNKSVVAYFFHQLTSAEKWRTSTYKRKRKKKSGVAGGNPAAALGHWGKEKKKKHLMRFVWIFKLVLLLVVFVNQSRW